MSRSYMKMVQGFRISRSTSEKSSKPLLLSQAAINSQKIWDIWCEFVTEELKSMFICARMNVKQGRCAWTYWPET